MILGILVVSDADALRRRFRREPLYAQSDTGSETVVDLPFQNTLIRFLRNSSHAGVPERNNSYIWHSNMIMVGAQETVIVNKSAAAHLTISEDTLPNYDVHIFYYPWYGNPTYDGVYLHWNHPVLPHWKLEISARYPIGRRHQPPDEIGSSFYPQLGPYSSRDPNVIADHMRQIRQSGAGYFCNYYS